MKKKNLLKGLLVSFLLLCSAHTWAYDFSAKNGDGVTIYYNYISYTELTCAVTFYSEYSSYNQNAYSGDVIIPETVRPNGIDKYSVVEIEEYAFRNCTGLTQVTIPSSITTIYRRAFYDCSNLTTVNYNATNCSINGGSTPFTSTTKLSTANIGDNVVTIPNYLFSDCSTLQEINVGEGVTSIGKYAFYNCTGVKKINFNAIACTSGSFSACTNLTTVNLGDNVTTIPSSMFSGCEYLTSIEFPNSLTQIDSSAFKNCSGLSGELLIPENVVSLGSDAFSGCTGLTSINYEATNCTSAGSSSSTVFNKCSSIASVNIGENVTIIPDYLFYNCSGLCEIIIPSNITSIGDYAFAECNNLAEVTFNANSCPSAGSASYPTFGGNSNLTKVTIGDKVTVLADNLFKGCTNITSLIVENATPPTIYSNTFEDIPNAEVPMEGLNKYAIASYWTDIPTIYANNDGIIYYPVPIYNEDSVAIIANGGDENGTVGTKGSSVEIIPIEGNNLTYGLVMYVTEDITNELVNKGSYSFPISEFHKENTVYCYSPSLENIYDITVSGAGEVLNNIAVSNINSVYSLKVSGNINGTDITTIRKMVNLRILDLSDAYVVSGGEAYYENYTTSKDKVGKNFFYDMDLLLLVKIPNSATEIEAYAFGNCTGLMTTAIPKKVTSIADYAFANCTSLANLTFEDGTNTLTLSSNTYSKCPITTLHVGRNLNYQSTTSNLPFRNLDTLKSLTIGNYIYTILDYEFAGGANLITLDLGDRLTYIGDNAFNGCTSLSEINSKNPTPPELESNTFNNVDKETCVLNVPAGSLNDYWVHKYWRDFLNINEVEYTDDLYEELLEEINSIEDLLEDVWYTITTDYVDVANDFKDEYNTLANELKQLLDELEDAYDTNALTNELAEEIRAKLEDIKQSIEAMLAAAKDAHEELTGIYNINIDPSEIEGVYSTSGQKINTPQKGINIVRYSDGTTRKILVQ